MKYLVFDLETKECPGTKEVSWKDFEKMGIGIGCAWLSWEAEYRLYQDEDLLLLLADMKAADVITGWNIIQFDWNLVLGVLKAQGFRLTVEEERTIREKLYDPLADVRSIYGPFAKGWKLDDVLARLKLAPKKGSGADAPGLYKDGKWGKLCTYVLGDVKGERDVFKHAVKTGWLPGPDGKEVQLPMLKSLLRRFEVAADKVPA